MALCGRYDVSLLDCYSPRFHAHLPAAAAANQERQVPGVRSRLRTAHHRETAVGLRRVCRCCGAHAGHMGLRSDCDSIRAAVRELGTDGKPCALDVARLVTSSGV